MSAFLPGGGGLSYMGTAPFDSALDNFSPRFGEGR